MMNQKPSNPLKHLVVCILALLFCPEAGADWPFFYKSYLAADVYWAQRDVKLQEDRLDEDELRAGFEIRQRGYWEDPRIVRFVYTLQPTFSTLKNSPEDKQDSELLNYSIGVDILHGATLPVEASLNSFMSNNEYKATLGGRAKSRVRQNSVLLRWKFEPFPMEFMVAERDDYHESNSVFSESVIERDDLFRTFRIRGASSKMNLFMEHETRDDQIEGRNNDLERDNLRLRHQFHWGRNSRLDSRFEYRRRMDVQEFTTGSFMQDFQVQHTENIDSELNYRIDSASGAFDTDTLDIRYKLNHYLYQNMTSSAFLFKRDQRSESMDANETGAGVSIQYGKDFFGTRVGTSTFYKYSLFDRTSGQGFIEVIDEAYQIPPNGETALSNRFIQEDSVVVTDVTGGINYIQGIDYQVLDLGLGLFILSVIPGGEIEIGQSILVSYFAALQPSAEFTETEYSYNISVSRGGLTFKHYALRTNTDLEEGFLLDQLLDRRQTYSNIGYSWNTGRAGYHLSAGTDLWQDRGVKVTSENILGTATVSISQAVNMSMTLSHQDSRNVGRNEVGEGAGGNYELDSRFTNLRLGLNWKVTGSFNIRSSVLAWRRSHEFRQEPLRSFEEDIVGVEIDFDYQFRRFSANLQVYYNDWEIKRAVPDSDYLRTDDGFRLRVRRYF